MSAANATDLLTGVMDDLRVSLLASLKGTTHGEPACACTLMPGLSAPADWCTCRKSGRAGKGCGMAWVRLDRLFPSGDKFPAQDTTPRRSCTAVLAAVLEVGVYRCAPLPDTQGNPPSPAEQTNAALGQASDAMALWAAIRDCDAVTKRPSILGTYAPRDGGDCGGGVWTVTVQLLPRPAHGR